MFIQDLGVLLLRLDLRPLDERVSARTIINSIRIYQGCKAKPRCYIAERPQMYMPKPRHKQCGPDWQIDMTCSWWLSNPLDPWIEFPEMKEGPHFGEWKKISSLPFRNLTYLVNFFARPLEEQRILVLSSLQPGHCTTKRDFSFRHSPERLQAVTRPPPWI